MKCPIIFQDHDYETIDIYDIAPGSQYHRITVYCILPTTGARYTHCNVMGRRLYVFVVMGVGGLKI